MVILTVYALRENPVELAFPKNRCFLFVYTGVIHKLLSITFYRCTAWFATAPIRHFISQWDLGR